jgi:hypothetical protein
VFCVCWLRVASVFTAGGRDQITLTVEVKRSFFDIGESVRVGDRGDLMPLLFV